MFFLVFVFVLAGVIYDTLAVRTAKKNPRGVWLHPPHHRENCRLLFSWENASSRAVGSIDDWIPLSACYWWQLRVHRHAGHVENHMNVFFVRRETSDGEGKALGSAVVPCRVV